MSVTRFLKRIFGRNPMYSRNRFIRRAERQRLIGEWHNMRRAGGSVTPLPPQSTPKVKPPPPPPGKD